MTVAVKSTAPRHPGDSRLPGIILAITALAAAVVLLATNPHLLVQLTSNRDGAALLPVTTLAPGTSTTGSLTLADEGMLPLRYDVQVRPGSADPNQEILRIRHAGEANYVYQGPLPQRPVALGALVPGQRVTLEVTLVAPPSDSTNSMPADQTFVWTARSPGFGSWWWLLGVALALVVVAFAAPRLFALWAERVRGIRLPFELYWRAPLILAVLSVAMVVPLSGVSLASVNSQTANPDGTFGVGEVVLNDQAPAGRTCMDVAGASSTSTRPDCSAVFHFEHGAPGQAQTGRVTIRNAGTVPLGQFRVWAPGGCVTEDAPGEPAHGTGQACDVVAMQVHDDTHDACYYPVRRAGACPAGGSMGDFGRSHPDFARGLDLDPADLGDGVTFAFTVTIDRAAANDVQGRAPVMDFEWQVASA